MDGRPFTERPQYSLFLPLTRSVNLESGFQHFSTSWMILVRMLLLEIKMNVDFHDVAVNCGALFLVNSSIINEVFTTQL